MYYKNCSLGISTTFVIFDFLKFIPNSPHFTLVLYRTTHIVVCIYFYKKIILLSESAYFWVLKIQKYINIFEYFVALWLYCQLLFFLSYQCFVVLRFMWTFWFCSLFCFAILWYIKNWSKIQTKIYSYVCMYIYICYIISTIGGIFKII